MGVSARASSALRAALCPAPTASVGVDMSEISTAAVTDGSGTVRGSGVCLLLGGEVPLLLVEGVLAEGDML